jgi:uncharacterized protein (TIGR00290 family)
MYRAMQAGARVEWLVNMLIEDGKRSRSHGLRRDIIEAQSAAMGIQLAGAPTSWDEYEATFIDTLHALADEGIRAGIFGDIDIPDHLDWERKVCEAAGMSAVLPLWQGNRMELVREFVSEGFVALIVAVRAEALSPDYLGKALDIELAEEFRRLGIDPCGENGEFHTVVIDGPCFAEPIGIVTGDRVLRSDCWFLDVDLGA